MKLFHENPIFETVKSKVIISLFETVRLSVSISPRNLYNSLKSIKENLIRHELEKMSFDMSTVRSTSNSCSGRVQQQMAENTVLATMERMNGRCGNIIRCIQVFL